MAAQGIHVYMFRELMPTPVLSFAVRELQCGAGIMITASHNGKEYNGFKCYGSDGCQMTEKAAAAVLRSMEDFDYFDLPSKSKVEIEYIDGGLLEKYAAAVKEQCLRFDVLADTDLKIMYTPLNGAGGAVLPKVLANCGLKNVQVVKTQEKPDGNFTTCPKPNPEIAEAYNEAVKAAAASGSDLILATDPDADRLGVMVRHNGSYRLLNGNEIGCLLLDYILKTKKEKSIFPENPVVIKTVVTAPMAEKIAEAYGCSVINLPVGFKYICEQVEVLKKAGRIDDFVLGFEESNGYLCGGYTGDKDGILAALLFTETAAYYKRQGINIVDKLNSLNKEYGYHYNETQDLVFDGMVGKEKMQSFMAKLHDEPLQKLGDKKSAVWADYLECSENNLETGKLTKINLPPNDMVQFIFTDGCSLVVRPSGTEPKLKIYYNTAADNFSDAEKNAAAMKNNMMAIIAPYI